MHRSHFSGRAEVAHRAGHYRPQVLLLEDRLPPGDALLGALLGPGLLGVGLVRDSSLAIAMASSSRSSRTPLEVGPGQAPLATIDLANLATLTELASGQMEHTSPADRSPGRVPLPEPEVSGDAPQWFRDASPQGLTVNGGAMSAAAIGLGLPSDARFWTGWTGFTGASQATTLPGSELSDVAAMLQRAASGSANLAAADLAAATPLHFNPVSGLLAIRGATGGGAVREGMSAGGFLEVTFAGRTHSSDPASAAFDPALASANMANLRGILSAGGENGKLVLEGQTLASGLTVQADGPVQVTGNVTVAGAAAIAAPTITVRGTLQGSALSLTSAGLLNVAAGSVLTAAQDGQGGAVTLTAGVLVNVGQIHADGVAGGTVVIHAGNFLNGGRITADGQADGGSVRVGFTGSYIDTAAALTAAEGVRGGRVLLDGGTTGRLFSSGTQEARGSAVAGTVNLHSGAVPRTGSASGFSLVDPHPAPGGSFGWSITPLANGNVVVTNPHDDFVAPDSGAAYLVNGRSGALLGALLGGTAGDQVGGTGVQNPDPSRSEDSGSGWNSNREVAMEKGDAGDSGSDSGSDGPEGNEPPPPGSSFPVGSGGAGALMNGNYVVLSPYWNSFRGAATWGDGNAGTSGIVDDTNSLVGSNPSDNCYHDNSGDCVGSDGITALSNGNYVVRSAYWNGSRGAATWGDGTIGSSGTIDASNSLVGSQPTDRVGGYGITALSNGNYVVASPAWNGGPYNGFGAATWGDGTVGISGSVDASNSLVGSQPGDFVGESITALSNGNYVVRSPYWNGGRLFYGFGAATWGDGTVGISGSVDASNSLVGSHPDDEVGVLITALSNGNYVVQSPSWNGGFGHGEGAATWADGTVGISGTIDASNSLVGSHPGDEVGYRLTALSNSNYVVGSPNWYGRSGAATWADGTIGITGTVDATNSLVGIFQPRGNDEVGSSITALSNGNYVVASPYWNGYRGAVTWGDGTIGITGTIDVSNSLVGSNAGNTCGSGDCVGDDGITALSNGNYVVGNPSWNGGRGAATWGDGTIGITGTIDASNSLVGSQPGDGVGGGITALSNGNYVVDSPYWNGGINNGFGAATWGDGSVGTTGTVDASNSFVGSQPGDHVGAADITALSNGNYVVRNWAWNGYRGAVTWADGTIGITGTADASNSLVGSQPGDEVGEGDTTALSNGNYVVRSPYWNGGVYDGFGAVTWGDGSVGITGTVDAGNSLVGSHPDDKVGSYYVITALSNGNYVVCSPDWDSGRGAATWGDGTVGITGPVDDTNSLTG